MYPLLLTQNALRIRQVQELLQLLALAASFWAALDCTKVLNFEICHKKMNMKKEIKRKLSLPNLHIVT